MLVVVALVAGTREAGRIGRSRDIYAGAIAAIFASIALAWAVNHLITDDASDTLEGIFQLLAAATLFYVSSWLTSKSQADRWMNFISHQLEDAEHSTIPGIALGADGVSRGDARGCRDDRVLPGAHRRRDRNCRESCGRWPASSRPRSRSAHHVRRHPARRASNSDAALLTRPRSCSMGSRWFSSARASRASRNPVVPATFVNMRRQFRCSVCIRRCRSLGAQAAADLRARCDVHSARRAARRSGCGASGDAAGAPDLSAAPERKNRVAAEQHDLDVRAQLLGYHQRARSHPRALIDHRIARDRTFPRRASARRANLRAIEQNRQPRHDHRGRIAAARRRASA